MPTRLSTMAVEKSAFIIKAAFANENGEAMTPASLAWTLTDAEGAVINERDGVEVLSLSASVNIVLSGDDLAMQDGETDVATRILTLEGTYPSAVTSGPLPFKDSVLFLIQGLVAVA